MNLGVDATHTRYIHTHTHHRSLYISDLYRIFVGEAPQNNIEPENRPTQKINVQKPSNTLAKVGSCFAKLRDGDSVFQLQLDLQIKGP